MNRRPWMIAGAGVVSLAAAGYGFSQTAAPVRTQSAQAPSTQAAPPSAERTARILRDRRALDQLVQRRAPTGAQTGAQAEPRGVDWTGIRRVDPNYGGEQIAQRLGFDQAQIDATRIPILLPNDPSMLEGARIFSTGDFYAVRQEKADVTVTLSGTIEMRQVNPALIAAIRPEGPLQLTEQAMVGGRFASFVRFGVLYEVMVECVNDRDARCADAAYIKGLVAKSTGVVLGAAARQRATKAMQP